jgi:hypothetical protein
MPIDWGFDVFTPIWIIQDMLGQFAPAKNDN